MLSELHTISTLMRLGQLALAEKVKSRVLCFHSKIEAGKKHCRCTSTNHQIFVGGLVQLRPSDQGAEDL